MKKINNNHKIKDTLIIPILLGIMLIIFDTVKDILLSIYRFFSVIDFTKDKDINDGYIILIKGDLLDMKDLV